jgi:xylan 1,4-beta-xylosidase
MKRFSILILIPVLAFMYRTEASAQHRKPATYCNPVNIDYGYTPIPDFANRGHHRTTADPVITLFNGDTGGAKT